VTDRRTTSRGKHVQVASDAIPESAPYAPRVDLIVRDAAAVIFNTFEARKDDTQQKFQKFSKK
jgi:hypothetical protein